MSPRESWTERLSRWRDGIEARRAARDGVAALFRTPPEPRGIGRIARGRHLLAGDVMLDGRLHKAAGRAIWDLAADDPAAQAEIQGFDWLDDLAAVGDARARAIAQDWTLGWIDRYGRGIGPGWTPDLTGARVIRWINQADFVLRGRSPEDGARVLRSLGGQTLYLARRWRRTSPGLPRFQALSGLALAALTLDGLEGLAEAALDGLAHECIRQIDGDGGIASRSPEDLLEVLTLLTWVTGALAGAGRAPLHPIAAAMARIVPTLRALRHADGGLPRFHGGGRGIEGRLDGALAEARVRGRRSGTLAMGFARLQGGRTTLIADAASPPAGRASAEAHASTLAIELTSGRRPVVVNCGSGRGFGPEWRRAGRATPSHSALGLNGVSSSRLAFAGQRGPDLIAERPESVVAHLTALEGATRLELSHDGWRGSHGLTHARVLDLGLDGRSLAGEDILATLTEADAARFDAVMDELQLEGLGYTVRFHLHPDAEAEIDANGTAVSITLRSGEIWVFRHDSLARLTLERSVYLETGRVRPRPAAQVVLTGRAMSYATRVRWSLAKAPETPDTVRDYAAADEEE